MEFCDCYMPAAVVPDLVLSMTLSESLATREFRDVVFEDVVIDNNSSVIPY